MMRPTVRNLQFQKSDMAGFWKIEKSPDIGRSFSDFNEIWQGDAVWPWWPFGPLQIQNL